MSVLFVTGAGTEIGKTYVTCALARQLRTAGRAVRAFKPVATGIAELDDPAFQHSDTAQLLAAQGSPCDETTIAACTPWRFAAPLSPDMAAAAESRRLELAEITDLGTRRDLTNFGGDDCSDRGRWRRDEPDRVRCFEH